MPATLSGRFPQLLAIPNPGPMSRSDPHERKWPNVVRSPGLPKTIRLVHSLGDHAAYRGKLNDRPEWLENYQHRPCYGFIKVSLHPDGKKKVTYEIEYAVKVKLVNGAVQK